MADFLALPVSEQVKFVVRAFLKEKGIPDNPTTLEDRDKLNKEIGYLTGVLDDLDAQVSANPALADTPVTLDLFPPELKAELLSYLPAGYTINSITLNQLKQVLSGTINSLTTLAKNISPATYTAPSPVIPTPQVFANPTNPVGSQNTATRNTNSFSSGIKGALGDAANAIFGSDYLRDYRHAAKTFRTQSYAYAPKYKFLFHTYFNINSQAWPEGTGKNFGLLVKDVKLPSYGFNIQEMNQYNRKRIIQTKIKYDPVQITFHDDNSNTINKMWYAYYTYYYNDANKPNVVFAGNRGSGRQPNGVNNATQDTAANYNINNIYKNSITGNTNWGYYGEALQSTEDGQKYPFFKNITIFGFNQHNFTAYTLINPIITTFGHDTYNYEEGGGVMKNTMTLNYETVVYNEGAIDGRKPDDIVTGFGDQANYDRKSSPIMQPGANGTILGPGGLVDGAGGFVNDLSGGNILGAVIKGGTLYNTWKNKDLKSTAKYEMLNMLAQSAWEFGSPIARNRNIMFDIPAKSVTPYTVGVAGAPTIAPPQTQVVTNMPNREVTPTAGTQVTKSPYVPRG